VKEWLFTNTALACVYRAAEQTSEAKPLAAPTIPLTPKFVTPRQADESAFPADYTSTLAALVAVEREIAAVGGDLDRALRLIAERAIAFTHSTGAAVALMDGPEMVCRGSAGPDSPGLGVRFNIGAGFSGECVRTGRTLRCEDTETDPFVDKEGCRALGVRSMVAVPIRRQESVIGLLEIFSPWPAAFGIQDETVMQRLAGMVPQSVHRAELEVRSRSRHAAPEVDDELYADLPAESRFFSSLSPTQKILLIAAALTLVVTLVWLLRPGSSPAKGTAGGIAPASGRARTVSLSQAAVPADTVQTFPEVRKLADQGDPAAQFAVGAHYASGEDAPQDYAEAARWFTKAAEQGHVGAQATLGAYYWSGRGVPRDLSKAYFWAILAQTGGDDASKYRVGLLSSGMSRAQIVEAQQQANDWLKQHESARASASSQLK
jgi:putative methionine-R-sulfoxide reductase with GAF domain